MKTKQLLLRVEALTIPGTMHGQDATIKKTGKRLSKSIATSLSPTNFFTGSPYTYINGKQSAINLNLVAGSCTVDLNKYSTPNTNNYI